MKKLAIILATTMLSFAFGCKKTYVCTGTDGQGERTFTCRDCKKKEKSKYEQEIKDKGYTNVQCVIQ